jgi:hypothetical protein
VSEPTPDPSASPLRAIAEAERIVHDLGIPNGRLRVVAGHVERIMAAAEQRGAARAYDREVLVNVFVYHWPTNTSGCWCGWSVLGASFPEHVADVYEESVRALAPDTTHEGEGHR